MLLSSRMTRWQGMTSARDYRHRQWRLPHSFRFARSLSQSPGMTRRAWMRCNSFPHARLKRSGLDVERQVDARLLPPRCWSTLLSQRFNDGLIIVSRESIDAFGYSANNAALSSASESPSATSKRRARGGESTRPKGQAAIVYNPHPLPAAAVGSRRHAEPRRRLLVKTTARSITSVVTCLSPPMRLP